MGKGNKENTHEYIASRDYTVDWILETDPAKVEDTICEDCGHSRSEHKGLYCEECLRQSNDRGQWNGSPCA